MIIKKIAGGKMFFKKAKKKVSDTPEEKKAKGIDAYFTALSFEKKLNNEECSFSTKKCHFINMRLWFTNAYYKYHYEKAFEKASFYNQFSDYEEYEKYLSEKNDNEKDDKDNNFYNKERVDLIAAKNLFMIDDDAIDYEFLKKQRNRLIKVFHPDNDTDIKDNYSMKINDAFDILKDYYGF